jgi:hypothetical protein
VLVATINKVRVVELLGSEAEVLGLLLIGRNLRVDTFKLAQGLLTAAVVLVEVALSHLLDEGFEFVLKFANLGVVLLGLTGNNRSNFLLDVLGELLKTSPVVKELLGLLDLGVLGEVLGGEEVKGLLELVELEHHGILLDMHGVNGVNDSEERLNLGEVLILGVGGRGGLLHPCLGLLDNLGDVLGEEGASQGVVVSRGGRAEGCLVGGATKGNHLLFVVTEEHTDVHVALLVNLVLNEVLTVIVVTDLAGDFDTLVSLDHNLEDITTGLTVLAFVVSCLDDKFDGLTNSLISKNTWTKAERLVGTGVQEVGVVNVGGGEFVTKDGELDSALLGSKLFEVGCDSGNLSLGDEDTSNVEGVLGGHIGGLPANGEVDLDGLVLEALTPDVNWDTTGKLTEWGVDMSNGVRGTDNLVNSKSMEVIEPSVVPAAKDK